MLVYVALNAWGFVYVNYVNDGAKTLFTRHMFTTYNNNAYEFVTVVLLSFAVFCCSALVTMRSVYSLDGYCQDDINHSKCQIFTKDEVFDYNVRYWFAFYLLGIQFTHGDKGPIRKWAFSYDFIIQWGISQWTLTIVLVASMYYTITNLQDFYVEANVSSAYATVALVMLGFLLLQTIVFYGTLYFHLHRYTFGLLCLPFLCFQEPFVTGLHGLLNGLMIEGIARWGPDAVWIPSSTSQ